MGADQERNMAKLTRNDLVQDLRNLGVGQGDLINVKASLRSIGNIQGGVDTLIEAILEAVGPSGTIVTDSFVDVHSPFSRAFWKNIVDQGAPSYAGALANAMLMRSDVHRSRHPVQKFALIGAMAETLATGHTPDSYAYDVLRIMAERGGKNLKIGADEKVPGVGTTHVAIGLAGLRQKRPLAGVRYKDAHGKVRSFYRNWSGGCMKAFYNLNSSYDRAPGAILGKGKVGEAPAKLTSMGTTLRLEQELIRTNAGRFLRCGNLACLDCRFSWEGVSDPLAPFLWTSVAHGRFKEAAKALLYRVVYRYPF